MVVVDYTRKFTKVKVEQGAKPNFWSLAEPNIRSVAGAKSFSILLGSPSTYINYKFVCFHYLGILDNIYIVYTVSVDVKSSQYLEGLLE